MSGEFREFILLATMAAMPISMRAAQRPTVEMLRQTLVLHRAANDSDADIAKQVRSLELVIDAENSHPFGHPDLGCTAHFENLIDLPLVKQ
jgi:hypothetical protein